MMRPHDARSILIAGPTAGGKSGLALSLAERLGGVVINADSMQVYRELRILTARPTREEELRAPHALYGFVNGSEAYSAGRYAADAARAIADARAQGRVPVVVGGTGLYFKVLLEGLSPLAAHISGRLSLEEAAAVAKAETRQYAKRQMTWLKRNMIAWKTIDAQFLQRFDRDDLLFSDP